MANAGRPSVFCTWSLVEGEPVTGALERDLRGDHVHGGADGLAEGRVGEHLEHLGGAGVVGQLVAELHGRHHDGGAATRATGRTGEPVLCAPQAGPSVINVTTSLDREKHDLLDRAIDLARTRRGAGGPPQETVDLLIRAYYRHVAPEDVCDRCDLDLYGAIASHYKLAAAAPRAPPRCGSSRPA